MAQRTKAEPMSDPKEVTPQPENGSQRALRFSNQRELITQAIEKYFPRVPNDLVHAISNILQSETESLREERDRLREALKEVSTVFESKHPYIADVVCVGEMEPVYNLKNGFPTRIYKIVWNCLHPDQLVKITP